MRQAVLFLLVATLLVSLWAPSTGLAQGLRQQEEEALLVDYNAVVDGIKDKELKRRVLALIESGSSQAISIGSAKKGQVGKLANISTTQTARPSNENPRVWVMGASEVRDTYFRVDSVVDKRNMIIADFRAWVEGVDTSEIIDDSNHNFAPYTFECLGTKTYETEDGTRTVRHFILLDPTEINPILKELDHVASYRVWLDKDEKHATRAQFVDFKKGDVLLRSASGKDLAVKITRLSKIDQAWVRDAVKQW